MNEYEVRVSDADGTERRLLIEAATARAARTEVEDTDAGEVIAVRLLRVLGFSCRRR